MVGVVIVAGGWKGVGRRVMVEVVIIVGVCKGGGKLIVGVVTTGGG